MNETIDQTVSTVAPPRPSHRVGILHVWKSKEEALEALFVVLTLLGLVVGIIAEARSASATVMLVIHIATYFFGGIFAVKEIIGALKEARIEVDLLMVLAALGAAYVGAWTEGAMLLFLFSLSNVLQNYAMGRTRHAISALLSLRPDTVPMRQDGAIVDIPLDRAATGDIFVLRPGDRVALDGEVLSGSGYFDESSVTGESIPVEKTVGDTVLAGTLNQSGAFDVRVDKPASESTLSRIIEMVQEARERKATMESFLDRAERYYAVGVIVLVILYIVGMTVLAGGVFSDVFYRAMVLLTVASPCALVISVPASVLSAIAGGARSGVLFKGGGYVEALQRVRTIAFDKTGTLTYGTPEVAEVIPSTGTTEERLLTVCASAEIHSRHPIARSIVRYAASQGIVLREPDTFEEKIGMGVSAMIDGAPVLIGSPRMIQEQGITLADEDERRVTELRKKGMKTVLLVYFGGTYLGTITVMDKERSDAAQQILRLKESGINRVVMLTGDDPTTAETIANRLGIDEYHAGLMPEDKVTKIEELQKRYGPVAMVGDGVNDAPALARAEVGIAMGAAGTDAALESADVVLMADDLGALVRAIRIGRKTRRIVTGNIVFAMSVIVVLVALTLTVGVPLPLGVLGHEGSTVIVVLNGLRLIRRTAVA